MEYVCKVVINDSVDNKSIGLRYKKKGAPFTKWKTHYWYDSPLKHEWVGEKWWGFEPELQRLISMDDNTFLKEVEQIIKQKNEVDNIKITNRTNRQERIKKLRGKGRFTIQIKEGE